MDTNFSSMEIDKVMALIRTDPLIKLLQLWFEYNVQNCFNNFALKGGWEGWLQVEIAKNLITEGLTVQRETPIFSNPRARVDLVVNWSQDIQDTAIFLEFKAEALFQSATGQNKDESHIFFKKFLDDIERLKTERLNRLKSNPALCVGLFFSNTLEKTIFATEIERNDIYRNDRYSEEWTIESYPRKGRNLMLVVIVKISH